MKAFCALIAFSWSLPCVSDVFGGWQLESQFPISRHSKCHSAYGIDTALCSGGPKFSFQVFGHFATNSKVLDANYQDLNSHTLAQLSHAFHIFNQCYRQNVTGIAVRQAAHEL